MNDAKNGGTEILSPEVSGKVSRRIKPAGRPSGQEFALDGVSKVRQCVGGTSATCRKITRFVPKESKCDMAWYMRRAIELKYKPLNAGLGGWLRRILSPAYVTDGTSGRPQSRLPMKNRLLSL